MPYSSVSDIPDYVKRKIKSKKKRRQWMHVFNSVYSATHNEGRAFAAANASIKRKKELTRAESEELIKYYVSGDLKGEYLIDDIDDDIDDI